MDESEVLLGLPGFQITGLQRTGSTMTISARYTGQISCPTCEGTELRLKDTFTRRIRHESWGSRHTFLELRAHKWKCLSCGSYFRERFPGILKGQRATEAFRHQVFQMHWDGINRSRLGKREGIGAATVERYFRHFLLRKCAERDGGLCPRVLGIDEHFFTRRKGYATTFCDLARHKVFDVVLGRSEAARRCR